MMINCAYKHFGSRGLMQIKAIVSSYPDKVWKLSTVKKVCSRVDYTGPAVLHQPGSGRPATAITNPNVERVDELICSQEGNNGTHLSTRQIAADLNISQSSAVLLKEICITRASVTYPHRTLMMRHVRRGWNVQELF